MTAGRVPTASITALYNNTTPGTVADPAAIDNAIADIVQTIDDNYDFAAGLISAGTLSRLGIINVKDYGASGSDTTTTGNLASGSKVLVVTSTDTFEEGHGVSVAGAGEAGADLVTSITSIVGTNVFLADEASTTVSAATVSHDETTAITSAITAANTAGGGIICFPSGTYKYSSVSITASNIELVGTPGATTLQSAMTYASNTPAFVIIGDNIVIDGITFNYVTTPDIYSEAHNSGGHTLNIGGTGTSDIRSNIMVKNCIVNGSYLFAIQFRYAKNVVVQDCEVYNSLGTGIYTADIVENLVIRRNTVHDCKDDLIMITCDSDNTDGTFGVRIHHNYLYNANSKAIGTSGVDGCIIESNHINYTKEPAIQIYADAFFSLGNSLNVFVQGNIIRNAGKFFNVTGAISETAGSSPFAIYIAGVTTTNVKIENNEIYNCQSYGITAIAGNKLQISNNSVDTALYGMSVGVDTGGVYNTITDLLVSDNYVYNTGNDGIMIFSATNVKVSNNQIQKWNTSGTANRRGLHVRNIQHGTVSNNHLYDELTRGSAYLVSGSNINLKYWGINQINTADTLNAGMLILDRRIMFGSAAPTSGTWFKGDIVFNTGAAASGKVGWVCTTAGTPGTWKTFGAIDA